VPVDCTIKLGVVTSIDQANRLPEDYEPLMVEEGKILLKTLLKTRYYSFCRHFQSTNILVCPKVDNNSVDPLVNDEQSSPENPFSILANLKTLEIYNGRTKK